MVSRGKNTVIAFSLVFAVALWGGSNSGIKYLVAFWPPLWTGCTRFLLAGLVLELLVRFGWVGKSVPLNSVQNKLLWTRSGLSLAICIIVLNLAVRFTAVSHVALYLGAS